MPNQHTIDSEADAAVAAMAQQLGSINKAAEHLGVSRRGAQGAVKRHAARQLASRGARSVAGMEVVRVSDRYDASGSLKGFSTVQKPACEDGQIEVDKTLPGFVHKKISALFGADGSLIQQWQIQSPERAAIAESVRAFVEGICEGKPPGALINPPSASDDDLLCVYPMGDPHFGMRAHAPEAGENFDLKIAERDTKAVVDRLVSSAPPAKRAILANLGDFFHADDNSARTKQSGNPLDVDGRWHEVLRVGGWTMVHLVNRLLQKHEIVEVLNERGNHDDISAIAMAIALGMHFHNNPRVIIHDPASYFHFREFGVNLLGFTHGDGPKEADLIGIMANDEPEAWGRTKHRVFHRGHFHHDRVIDLTGGTVETHRTLAASDAWHRKTGYRAKRDMKAITYHRAFGEIARSRVNLDMVA
jgi:hypothetical protein